MKLSRIIVFTPDVERLAAFYRSAFQLEEVPGGDTAWRELNAGGCSVAFHKLNELVCGRDGWIKPVFMASDVEAERSRLSVLGVEMSDIVHYEDIDLCDGKDPDGNPFQISSRPAQGVPDNEGR